jgi:hypothetical protein
MQLKAKVENQDRAKRGKNDAGRMKSSSWRGKQVRNGTADNRSDDAEHDCPEDRHVHVQHRFRDDPSDQPNNDVPDQVKHNFSPVVLPAESGRSMATAFTIGQTFCERQTAAAADTAALQRSRD